MVYLFICLLVDWLLTKRYLSSKHCCACLREACATAKALATRGQRSKVTHLYFHLSMQQKIGHQEQKPCFCDENSKKIDLGKWNCVRNISEVVQTYSKKLIQKNRQPPTNNISPKVLI